MAHQNGKLRRLDPLGEVVGRLVGAVGPTHGEGFGCQPLADKNAHTIPLPFHTIPNTMPYHTKNAHTKSFHTTHVQHHVCPAQCPYPYQSITTNHTEPHHYNLSHTLKRVFRQGTYPVHTTWVSQTHPPPNSDRQTGYSWADLWAHANFVRH